MIITIPYNPYPWQVRVHEVKARYKVLVIPRGHGKSIMAVNEVIRCALSSNNSHARFAYIAISFKSAERIAWGYFKRFLVNVPGVKYNNSDLTITLPNGVEILLFGADNTIRGTHLDGVVLDEVAMMPHDIWDKVVRPMISAKNGWAMFIGTPDGQNLFFDLYEAAKNNNNWFAYKASVYDLGVRTKEEIEDMRSTMTPQAFKQELECSFAAAATGTYYAPMLDDALDCGRIVRFGTDIDLSIPVITSWDLGWNDPTSIWFFQHIQGKFVFIDFYENSRQMTVHYTNVIKSKPYTYQYHILPHDAVNHHPTSGKSAADIIAEQGLSVHICPRHSDKDRIAAAQVAFSNCIFDAEKCELGLKALRNYKATINMTKGNVNDSIPNHDWSSHAADAFGYAIVGHKKQNNYNINRHNRSRLLDNNYSDGPSIIF